jgi:hypothetical protein
MAVPIAPWGTPSRLGALATLVGLALSPPALAQETQNPAPPIPDASVTCDVLVVGGGLAGTATAYEALRAGRTVCLTDITDWVGGQISSQGTTALDEVGRQRALLFYAQGYLALRDRIPELYDGDLNPGDCWVSATCFLPADAHQILSELLLAAAESGGGELKWFPHTVAKDVTYSADGRQIASLTAIQHQAAPGTPPLNTEPLSAIIADAYRYGESDRLTKTVVEFVPAEDRAGPADWYVIEATETGELIGSDPDSPSFGSGRAIAPGSLLSSDGERSLLHPGLHLYLRHGSHGGAPAPPTAGLLRPVRPLFQL